MAIIGLLAVTVLMAVKNEYLIYLIRFFQLDGPSRSLAVPLWHGARRGPRARQCPTRGVRRLEVAVRRSAGALAATRQQSYGCAYSDVRWESTGTTFNIITIISLYISHGWSRNVFCVCGFVCLFSSICPGLLRFELLLHAPFYELSDTRPCASGSRASCEAPQRRLVRSVWLTHLSCDALLKFVWSSKKKRGALMCESSKLGYFSSLAQPGLFVFCVCPRRGDMGWTSVGCVKNEVRGRQCARKRTR